MLNLKSVVEDAKISPNCLKPKFNRPKIAAIRSYPLNFMQFNNVAVGKKLEYGENNVISCGDQAMEVEPVVDFERKPVEMSGDKKDSEQIAQIGSVDECGSTKHMDMLKVVDTLKRNFQVGDGACLDMVNELKMRKCDMTKSKRRKVSSLRDFPKDLKSYEVVDKKSQEYCVGKFGDIEINDEFDEHLKVDFMSQGGLVDPVVGSFSCGEEFEKQEHVVTVDEDLELHDEALKDKETIDEFECGDDDNKSYSMAENVSLVKTASEDAENPHLQNELCSLGYPCRFPKRRKVFAVRDFPDALRILKAHNVASEKNLNHRAANKSAGENETTCDSQEPANCGANSTPLSTQSNSEVTNSNKRIGGKEEGVKCVNKIIVEDSMATPRCPSMPSQRYRSDTKTNQDKCKGKDKVLKRKQNERSAPITVVLALMAPTKCPR